MIVLGSNSYNGFKRWRWLLESIRLRDPGLPRSDIRMVLVDDASPKEREMRAVASDYGADYIRFDGNRGISAGWNAICRHAWDQGATWAAVLNDDILVNDNWLVAMDVFLTRNKGISGVGWPIVWFDAEDVSAILADPATAPVRTLQPNLWGRPGCSGGAFAGCCFGVTREAWERIGGFDEGFKSFYEETLFGYQGLEAGYVPLQLSGPFLWHQWSQTFAASPELKGSDRMRFSRELFWDKTGTPKDQRHHDGRCFDYVSNKYRDRMVAPAPLTWWTPAGIQTT